MLNWLRKRFLGPGADVATVGVEQAYAMLMSDRLTLIDVRTPDEWRSSGIAKGAHCAALGTSEFEALLLGLANGPRPKVVGFICKAGTRSTRAAATARTQGYENIAIVQGGMDAWARVNLPLTPFDHI